MPWLSLRQISRQTPLSARKELKIDPKGGLFWYGRGILPIVDLKASMMLVLTTKSSIEVICRHAVADDGGDCRAVRIPAFRERLDAE